MYTPSARRGTILLVVILLLISILLEQAIAGIFPLLGQLGGVRPMIVFLDIPLGTPVKIDWLPVGFIFMIFYSVVGIHREENRDNGAGRSGTFSRGWAVLGRWWLLLILMLSGGGIYYGVSGFLPKEIRKGIESFGMRADLTLPYPSGETIHLNGSMIMLVFFVLGWRLLISKALPPATARPAEASPLPARQPENAANIAPVRTANEAKTTQIRAANAPKTAPFPARPKLSKPTPIVAAVTTPLSPAPQPPPVSSYAPSPAPSAPAPIPVSSPVRSRVAMRVPEPVEVKVPAGRSCVYVAMPAGFVRKRSSYPCVVDGDIRPAMLQKEPVPALWQS